MPKVLLEQGHIQCLFSTGAGDATAVDAARATRSWVNFMMYLEFLKTSIGDSTRRKNKVT